MRKTLILYYSQAVGNTEMIANKIAQKLHADMEKIDTIKPYQGTYEEISAEGHKEVNSGYKPLIKPINSDINNYDTLVIATPTWWYTMAPAIHTLLSTLDLKHKEIVLVQTHAGWPGHCLADMRKLCKKGKVISTMAVQFDSNGGDKQITSEKDFENWLMNID